LPTGTTNARLAVDRTRLAYERTMMAWGRTSTSLIFFGFTIHKFFQFRVEHGEAHTAWLLGPAQFGGLMVCIGLVTLLLASIDHRRSMNMLRTSYGPMPSSTAAAVGALIGGLGVLALVAMLLGA
jgi:putative membrane protein